MPVQTKSVKAEQKLWKIVPAGAGGHRAEEKSTAITSSDSKRR